MLLFYFLFASMQLIEYFLWRYPYKIAPAIHRLVCKMGWVIVMLQPLLLILIAHGPINQYLVSLWLFMMVLVVMSRQDIEWTAFPQDNGHLAWNWMPRSMVIISIWLFIFFVAMYKARVSYGESPWPTICFSALAVGVSLYCFMASNTWGSVWCWISNGIFLLLIIRAIYVNTRDTCPSIL